MRSSPTIGDIDALAASDAAARLAPLFEGAPRFLARLVSAGPFGSWEALFARARAIAHAMPEDEQVELVHAHPRLGAPRDAVSAASAREQGYGARAATPGARDTGLSPELPEDVARRLADLNDAYEARFGFRYCVFVAGRPLAALIPDFEAALAADRDTELHRALDAVVDIARARHEAGVGQAPER
jgi:2-oxo-4-hydroxy-4-carboxy--5-ureidoimidazoline (OHCU) decarboxylase